MKGMMRMGYALGLVLVVAALGACATARAQVQGEVEAASLAGTAWELVELNGQPPSSAGEPLTLQFAAHERRVSGSGGCNRFSGPYMESGASLRFGPLVSTRRACGEPVLNTQETAYLNALQSTTRHAIEADQLVLFRDDQALARFARAGK